MCCSTAFPDDSKFGQKLLEKYGWQKGRGLGVSQQGNTEPISVSQKDDNKGIGFKGHDDTWIAHQDDFSAALAKLNEEHNASSNQEQQSKKSLEEASKASKKRVQ